MTFLKILAFTAASAGLMCSTALAVSVGERATIQGAEMNSAAERFAQSGVRVNRLPNMAAPAEGALESPTGLGAEEPPEEPDAENAEAETGEAGEAAPDEGGSGGDSVDGEGPEAEAGGEAGAGPGGGESGGGGPGGGHGGGGGGGGG